MTDRPIRASDKDRDLVVDVLRDAYTDGRLDIDEFQERTEAAYVARTWGELRDLTGDLPVEPMLGADLEPPAAEPVPVMKRQPRRRSPLGPVLPIVFIWVVISAAAHFPDTAAALAVLYLCLLACRVGAGGKRNE